MKIARWEWAALASLLVLLFSAVAYEAWTLGPTADEPSHILSSWLWWHGRDRLYPRDVPPLMKIVGGSAIAAVELPLPANLGKPGDQRSEWAEAASLFSHLPPDSLQSFLFRARLPMAVFPLLTLVVLWRWARELFGAFTALTVASFWAACPTVLGHSALFKNDVAATATYLLFWYCVGRFWHRPNALLVLAVSAAAAAAVLSKFSMLFVLAAAPLLICVGAAKARRYAMAAVWPLFCIAAIWLICAAAWRFELRLGDPAEIARLAADPDVPRWLGAALRVTQGIPVPEGALTGVISLFRSGSHPVPVYLLGQTFPEGHPVYFVLATVLKLSVPVLLLFAAGLVVLWRSRRFGAADVFWLAPGFLYFALASLASLHLGVRLVMPAWVFFFLIAGAAMRSLPRPVTLTALTCAFFLSASWYPWGISFFNPWAGDARNRLRLLADSNIDWGQSLGAVGRYAREHNIQKLHLAYFGFDRWERYFKPGQVEPVVVPWDGKSDIEVLQPEKGWYAISATLLPGQLLQPRYRGYFGEFLRRRPEAVAGGAIFIYRID